MALDKNIKAFVMHISSLSLELKVKINPAKKVQINLLLTKKVTVSTKYADFANIFSKESKKVLLKHTRINKHAIKLLDDKPPLYEV